MNFSSPIPVAMQPMTGEGSRLYPSRDRNSTAKQWQTNNKGIAQVSGVTNNVRRLQSEVRKIRGRALAPGQNLHPFTVYARDWNKYQVRGGLIGAKSRNSLESGHNAALLSNSPKYDGNQIIIEAYKGGDAIAETDGATWDSPIMPEDASAVAITEVKIPDDGTAIGSEFVNVKFVLPKTAPSDSNAEYLSAEFFAEPDDGLTFQYRIKARMLTETALIPGLAFSGLPAGSIPIASVPVSTNDSRIITQTNNPRYYYAEPMLFDHVFQRYPRGAMDYVGDWGLDSLSGKVMWPGDVVTVTKSSGSYFSGIVMNFTQVKNLWLRTGAADFVTDSPDVDSTGWKKIGGLF